MTSLEISSIKPSATIPKWIIFALTGVSFIGFLDATYLTAKHYLGEIPPCGLTSGCESVLTSQYATIFNIPVALGGAFYYLLIFVLLIAYLDTKNNRFMSVIPSITVIGLLASAWFMYLQFFVIKALCLYCLVSALTSTILFLLGSFVLHYKRRAAK